MHLLSRPFGPAARAALQLSLLLLMALGLAACGESTGGGGGAPTGSASIFLTDAPSDEFDQILVTLERIELRGGGAPVTIFSGSETIDLKELENFSDLFVHADRIPARSYSKIRLIVSRVELVRDEGTADEERFDAHVPANGKIDLNPRGPFEVKPGVDLVVELDMDAKKSIHIIETGQSEVFKFVPVVFVTIRDTETPKKLARVHGVVNEIIDDVSFELCSTRYMATPDFAAARPAGGDGGMGDRHRCTVVELDEDTGVFDSNGDPIDSSELAVDEYLTVIGAFYVVDANYDEEAAAAAGLLGGRTFHHRHGPDHPGGGPGSNGNGNGNGNGGRDSDSRSDSDSESDSDSDSASDSDSDSDGDGQRPPDVELVLLAYVIEVGPPGTFLSLRGVVESEVVDDAFDFAIAPGQGFGDESVVSALLQDGTRIFTRGGWEVGDDEIVPDTPALVDGVFSLSASDASVLKTALVVLEIIPDFEDEVRGIITDIDDDAQRLFVEEEDGDACVDADDDTIVLLIEDDEEGSTSTRGEFEDLEEGWRVEAYGSTETGDCLAADAIVAYPADVVPDECTTNDDCDTADYCEKPVGACEDGGFCSERPLLCTLEYVPVCGCDGMTYSNACAAAGAGVSIASEGECEPEPAECGGVEGVECAEGEVCRVPVGECGDDAEGECVARPEGCPDVWDPVCGCDGETYGNACEALAAGVAIEFEGECQPAEIVCGGIAGDECGEGEVCLFEPGECVSDAQGICIPKPEVCLDVFDPVCGCDGMTYDNECEAIAAGAIIASVGECTPPPS